MSTIPESPGVLPDSIVGFKMPKLDMPTLNIDGYNVLDQNLFSSILFGGPFHGVMKVVLNVCGKIINALSRPLLEILVDILRALIDLVTAILHPLLYFIQEILLNIIGYLEVVMRFLLGIDNLSINGADDQTIWEYMFHSSTLTKLFFYMVAFALPITFLIGLWKMVPKISENDTEQPVSVIARRLMLAIFRMLSIPAACMVMLYATTALVRGVRFSSKDYQCSLPDALFVALFAGFSRLSHIGEIDIGYGSFDGVEGSGMIDVGGINNQEQLIRDYLYGLNERRYNENIMVTADFENPGIVWLVIYYVECKCISAILGFIISAAKQGLRLIVIFVYGPLVTALSVDDAEMFDRYKRTFFAQFFAFLGAVLSLAGFYAVALSIAKFDVRYSTYREVDGIVRCTIVMVLVLCLDEVADMVTTLISGVHFGGYAESERQMAWVGDAMYSKVRKVTVEAAKKVIKVITMIATGGTSAGASAAGSGLGSVLGNSGGLKNMLGNGSGLNNMFGNGNGPGNGPGNLPGNKPSNQGLNPERNSNGPALTNKSILNAAKGLLNGNIEPAMDIANKVVKQITGKGMDKGLAGSFKKAFTGITNAMKNGPLQKLAKQGIDQLIGGDGKKGGDDKENGLLGIGGKGPAGAFLGVFKKVFGAIPGGQLLNKPLQELQSLMDDVTGDSPDKGEGKNKKETKKKGNKKNNLLGSLVGDGDEEEKGSGLIDNIPQKNPILKAAGKITEQVTNAVQDAIQGQVPSLGNPRESDPPKGNGNKFSGIPLIDNIGGLGSKDNKNDKDDGKK